MTIAVVPAAPGFSIPTADGRNQTTVVAWVVDAEKLTAKPVVAATQETPIVLPNNAVENGRRVASVSAFIEHTAAVRAQVEAADRAKAEADAKAAAEAAARALAEALAAAAAQSSSSSSTETSNARPS
jgi:hypothetical protein